MNIYHFMVEAVPFKSNPESQKHEGAYICCWVKAENPDDAMEMMKKLLRQEMWSLVKIEDFFEAQRERYIDMPDSLECYDNALRYGSDAMIFTW